MDVELEYKKRNDGMPILSRQDIEGISYQLLNEFSPQNLINPTELNTTAFLTDYLGLDVKNKYIGSIDSKILGLTVLGDEAKIPSLDEMYRPTILSETYGTVLISPNLFGRDNRSRRKYTEAHEGSHKILHTDYFYNLQYKNKGAQLCVVCRNIENYKKRKTNDSDWMEWQADSLAAALLMPKDIFSYVAKNAIRNAGVKRGYLISGNPNDKQLFWQIINEISSKFSVSHRAAQIRMIHLGLIKISKN